MKILVVAAHPDDEILGMGGTILKHRKKGDTVRVIFLATGIASRRTTKYRNSPKYEINESETKIIKNEIKSLRKNATSALKLLKVNDVNFYNFPDNEMDTVSLLQIVKTLENEISTFKPHVVYTHHRNDLNIDHQISFRAALTACRPINRQIEIISFEVPSSTEWNYPVTFNPNCFVNISKELTQKINALKMYKNEIKKFPHPRSAKYLKIIAEKWGSVSGDEASEAFEIIRRYEK